MVQARRSVGQFDEILEILERRVTAPLVDVIDERTAVGRYEHRVLAADLHVAFGVARVLGVFGGRRCLDNGAAQAARKAYPDTVDLSAALFQDVEGLGHVAEFDTDLLEDRVGIVFNQLQTLFVEHLEEWNLALDIGCALADYATAGAARIASSTTASAAC